MPELIAGKYEVLQTIGRGGMGTVYKAVQRNLDRVVAIKMLSEDLASDPEFRARFQQEATVVARLSHPNIVAVYDIEPHNHTFCIIMEYLEGENLQAKIDRDVTLPERDVVLIGAQVARALGYAHSQGIIHRDIKPDNIHVTPKGIAKVMDFGIARFLDSKLKTQTGISMGTPKFMSPEQVTGKNVDGQTDLYSLGVCLYYCLAGRPPFDGENAIAVATRHLYEAPEPPSRFNTSITHAVEKVILRALEKQKPDRYSNGFEMADALEGTLGIRSPIRIAEEASEVYAGATQKIAVQSVVGNAVAVSDMTPVEGITPADARKLMDTTSAIEGASAQGEISPATRQVPGIDDYELPSSAQYSSVRRAVASRPFLAKYWPALVLAATVLLVIIVAFAIRGRTNSLPGSDSGAETSATTLGAEQDFQQTQNQANQLVQQGKIGEAVAAWNNLLVRYTSPRYDDFRRRIDQQKNQLVAQAPLRESDVLYDYRRTKANQLMKRTGETQNPALAMAYLQGMIDLRPQERLWATQYRQLEGQTSQALQARTQAQRDAAAASRTEGRRLASSNAPGDFRKAEDAFVNAIRNEHERAENWLALADFYESRRLLDDARVMYRAAASAPAATGEERARARQKLEELSRS